MKRFALAGNPNCGKTTLFNSLTGSTAHVGNWPGVTVDRREGTYKKGAEPVAIVDLPGIYSLSPYTPEEVISRNYILDEKPDCVIDVVDATNLERNLYLTTQLLEMDVPVIVALNMMDVVEKAGDGVDEKLLEERLGVPVAKVSALKGKGLKELMDRAIEASRTPRKGATVIAEGKLTPLVDEMREELAATDAENPLFHAIKLAEGDEIEASLRPELASRAAEYRARFGDEGDFEAVVADCRYRVITSEYAPALRRAARPAEAEKEGDGKKKQKRGMGTVSDRIDRVLTHRVWGIPIFIVILFLIFHLTFSEDLLYLGAMGAFGGGEAEATESLPEEEAPAPTSAVDEFLADVDVHTFFGYEEGVYSPGVILFNALDTLMGLVGAAVSDALADSPEWVSGFLCDGVLGGLFAILSFLPQILMLFLFFSILEDSGYMARVAFILDRLFRRFGLSGRAFMPMIMGFGCSVPATINTRTLADRNERVATVRVIPFFSCGAKLPILTAIAGGIVSRFEVGNTDLITYGMYLLGIVVAIAAVLLMRNTTMKGDVPPFIMELPAYHLPQFKNLMLHLWEKVKHFVKKAFTIILASTIVIWFVSHFSWGWRFLGDEEMDESILAGIGQLIQPLFTPLGFGSQLKTAGWVFAVAAITGLIAKENVIATFGTLAACITAGTFVADEALEGVDSVVAMIEATGITIPALIAFIAFNMTTIPCFAAVATARAELPDRKSFRWTLLFWVGTSYLVSTAIYLIGSWWWTCFPILALVGVVIALIVLNNKGKISLKFGRGKA